MAFTAGSFLDHNNSLSLILFGTKVKCYIS